MKTYRPKSLIQGYKMGMGNKKLVAIPDKYKYQDINVAFDGKTMVLKNFSKDALAFRNQEDKFNGGSFLLAYYEWLPDGEYREPKVKKVEDKTPLVLPEADKPVDRSAVGKTPNLFLKCSCGGGLRRSEYRNEFEKKPMIDVRCVVCGKIYGEKSNGADKRNMA
jgi:hypothetical protein